MLIENYQEYRMNRKETTIFFCLGVVVCTLTGILFFDRILAAFLLFPLLIPIKTLCSKWLCEKRLNKLKTEFIDFLYSIGASIATGMHMREAIREAREEMKITAAESLMLTELDTMLAKMDASNMSERELLLDFANRSGIDDLVGFVQGYYIARDSGGDLVKTINRSTQIITDKLLIERDMKTLVAQKVFEGRLIAVLPPAIIACLRIMSPEYLDPLYSSAAGRLIMLASLGAMGFAFYYSGRLQKVIFTESIENSLPEFMSSLSLLLGSGMVLDSALARIAAKESKDKNMLITEFERIYGEARADNMPVLVKFREFAVASGSRELIRFCGILLSSADKGTELTEKLEREAEFMWHSSKKQIEEKSRLAETKMTFPMAVMLIVLIAITTAPALMSL